MSKTSAAARRKELLRLMADHGGNGREFADKIGYTHWSVRAWKCGARNISRHTLRHIQLILNHDDVPGL